MNLRISFQTATRTSVQQANFVNIRKTSHSSCLGVFTVLFKIRKVSDLTDVTTRLKLIFERSNASVNLSRGL